jgi:hypothetical protein
MCVIIFQGVGGMTMEKLKARTASTASGTQTARADGTHFSGCSLTPARPRINAPTLNQLPLPARSIRLPDVFKSLTHATCSG